MDEGAFRQQRFCCNQQLMQLGGSPGLVVMGGDLQSKGCGFESWRQLLDRNEIFRIDLL